MISLLSPRPVLVLVGAALAGLLAAVVAPSLGVPTPVLGAGGLVTLAAVGVLSLALGWRVRRDRDRPVAQRMDPLAAARVLVLGQASGFTGAALAGWHAAAALLVAARSGVEAPTVRDAGLLTAAGLLVLGAGVLVERWCRIPPEDDAPEGGPREDGGGRGVGPRRTPETEGGLAHGRH